MKSIEQYKLHYALTDVVKPKSKLEKIVYGLIAEFANDSNSAKFREDVTKLMVGLKPSEGKLGYDDDFEPIEVKPVNFTGRAVLAGSGNFSDFTWKRHTKYLADDARMLVSGFTHGKLLYIVDFPYTSLRERVEYVLNRKLPAGDVKGTYVRSLTFYWNSWVGGPYTLAYVRPNIENYKDCFNKKFYNMVLAP